MKKPQGNEKVLNILQKSLINKKVAHAYLFCGPEGVGKKLFATYFAKALNCEMKSNSPCESCNSCNKISKQIHPDVKIVNRETKQIKIEVIKEINSFIQSPPFEGNYKIVILDDAHKMNTNASNALLKTLEEPSANSVIILVTAYVKNLLPTIISRCVKINFAVLQQEAIKNILIEKGYEEEKIDVILPFCGGSVKRGMELLEADNFKIIEQLKSFITNCENKSFHEISFLAESITENNKEELFFSVLATLLREKMLHSLSTKEFPSCELFKAINNFEKSINFARFLRYNISRPFIIEALLISLFKISEGT